ncbi:hypothetical protein H2200_001145 [Cladophialophora chaetospira]|uniref:Uncharacterized protein n=1 Tax=Cladophialophora chaetospira TaxID=386627 RepID=A0AA39CNS3_9EURO|nr:hypothetical protein H2200_001145 [Cladophialophora chaetospira]
MEVSGFGDAAPEPREDRGPRIPPAKLTTINPTPTISIFYKADSRSPLTLVDGKFSRDAAMVFCNRIRDEFFEGDGPKPKSFTIVGGDLTAHKEVLAWIKQSVEEQSVIKFKEVSSPTPSPQQINLTITFQLDQDPGFFTAYANIVLTGYQLGIPARELSDPLLKRMGGIAKKKLMTWDEVEWFYQTTFPLSLPDDKVDPLREVAATSIFWAWWNATLDSEETPEEMCIVDELRQENPQLDDDLHAWCERNEAEVRRKWEEKDKAKKYGGQASTGDGAGAGWDQPVDTSGGGGWDQPATDAATGEWDNPAAANGWDAPHAKGAAVGGKTWDTADVIDENDAPFAPPNSLASPAFGGAKGINNHTPLPALSEITNGFVAGGGDWAEEVNEEVTDQGHQYATNQW